MIHRQLTLVTLILIITGLITGCGGSSKAKTDLVIFHAGSLSVPFAQIKKDYEKLNPSINIILESAGSRACARKITDLDRTCDIMASADYTVIDTLLIPEYADWNIPFAMNEMTIVYHEGSSYPEELNADNWYEILLKEDVAFGRSDPEADPCGYRTVMVSKLSELHYQVPDLAEKLLSKDIKYIRPKETDLLALLETGTIDYIFLYRSVAAQHGLDYLLLPDEVNLKSKDFADLYKQVSVKLVGMKPGEYITKKGKPMVYGITLVRNAPQRAQAVKFLEYLLSADKGMRTIEDMGQPSCVGMAVPNFDKIPPELQKFVKAL